MPDRSIVVPDWSIVVPDLSIISMLPPFGITPDDIIVFLSVGIIPEILVAGIAFIPGDSLRQVVVWVFGFL
jgi:hypothetical protein